jgi:hypothetical protein
MFSYINSYQEILKIAPFEMLYGQRRRTPIFWNGIGERQVFRPDIIQRHLETSSYCERELEGCSVTSEELHRS